MKLRERRGVDDWGGEGEGVDGRGGKELRSRRVDSRSKDVEERSGRCKGGVSVSYRIEVEVK